MLDAVFRTALSADAPLLDELGIDQRARASPVRVRYHPINSEELDDLPLLLEAP
jgi:hypothetical protein